MEFGAPVLAVCGFSGAGKTTLLEAAIPLLVGRGLRVAVVKHDAHGFTVDRPGKDSDRLFRAGATVVLGNAGEQFERRAAPLSLTATLARLACDHDLLLVEGHKGTLLPKFWLESAERSDASAGVPSEVTNGVTNEVTNIVGTLAWSARDAWNGDRLARFMEYIDRWLPVAWKARPLYRGLLLGGQSSRMGEPKQLVRFGGRTLGEIAAEALGAASGDGQTVVLGSGALPPALGGLPRLPDATGFGGPGAGLMAAHRWAPEAAWMVAACDHPWLRGEHLEWLRQQRQPGRLAVIPRQRDGHPCPTLALYEPQALEALERQAQADHEHNPRIFALLDLPGTLAPELPAEMADGWINVNTPEELRVEEEKPAANVARRDAR
jgi:molybdopterin-guanine dinucleotide biosynthesis protein MobB